MNKYRLRSLARYSMLLALIVLVQCAFAADRDGVLYEISRPGLANSYLMGTIHISDPRVIAVLEGFGPEIEESRVLIMEMVPDATAMMSASAGMFSRDSRLLKEKLDPKLYAQVLTAAANKGLDENAIQRLKPWALAVALSLPRETGPIMDQALYMKVLEQGKPVHGMETAAEQLAVFDQLTDAQQVTLLRDTIRQLDELPDLFEQMVLAYLSGSLEALQAVLELQQQSSDPEINQWFEGQLIVERNIKMRDRMLPYLEKGGAFVASGALHLSGDTGLVKLLQEQGYRVSPRQ
ncbi:MAG: TraB/GumN family protein [bacterium]